MNVWDSPLAQDAGIAIVAGGVGMVEPNRLCPEWKVRSLLPGALRPSTHLRPEFRLS